MHIFSLALPRDSAISLSQKGDIKDNHYIRKTNNNILRDL